jgi:heptosyltransferase-2
LRRERYDVVINLHRFLSSGLITAFSGARRTIGFDKNPMSWSFSSRYPHFISATGTKHEVERNLTLISSLTDDALNEKPRLYPSQDAYSKMKVNEPYICIAPASIWFTKQWPKERWIALINRFADQYLVFLLGSKHDIALCEEIKTQSAPTHVRNVAGTLSLLESAALMQHAKMNYVNDSAPMHLASAVNAPVTAVFCSTVPAFGFGPLSDESYIAETALVLDCRPCGLHGHQACPRGHFRCAEIEIESLQ